MASAGISQDTLATSLGVSQAAVSRRLTGAVAFDVTELDALAQLFGVPASRLLGEDAA